VFTENKREYTLISSQEFGVVAYVIIGAMLVGSIKITRFLFCSSFSSSSFLVSVYHPFPTSYSVSVLEAQLFRGWMRLGTLPLVDPPLSASLRKAP